MLWIPVLFGCLTARCERVDGGWVIESGVSIVFRTIDFPLPNSESRASRDMLGWTSTRCPCVARLLRRASCVVYSMTIIFLCIIRKALRRG